MSDTQSEEPFGTRDGIRRELRRLARAEAEVFEFPGPVEDCGLLSEAFSQARKHGLSLAKLRTIRGRFLRQGRLRRILARLYGAKGPEFEPWRALQSVVFERTLATARDYDALIEDVSRVAGEVTALSSAFRVRFEARLTLAYVDPARLSALCQLLVRLGFTPVDLAFGFPPLAGAEAARLKRDLGVFCTDPVTRNRSLRLSGFPFCFLPAGDYPLLYRTLAYSEGVVGDIAGQRHALDASEAAAYQVLPPCCSCRRRQACYALSGIQSHPGYAPHLRASRETALVFAGGSLSPEDRRDLRRPELVFTGPAEQGSFFMALLEGFRDIILLDGYFYDRYGLPTFEVMLALERGINVFGGASIGALRAQELDRHGMRGLGYVYRFLKRHAVVPYHSVAQTYHDGDRPLTVPLVGIRYFLETAADDGVIDRRDIDRYYATAEGIHFPRLTFRHFLGKLGAAAGRDAQARLSGYLEKRGAGAFDIKRKDALDLLAAYKGMIRRDGPDFVPDAFDEAGRLCLTRLKAKFDAGWDRTLPARWKEPLAPGAPRRERDLAETIAIARRFFADLDVITADISRFDPTGFFVVNAIFVPFYYLRYVISSASGYGQTLDEALVSGYMELIERIPMARGTASVSRAGLRAPVFASRRLPMFYALAEEQKKALGIVDGRGGPRDAGFIECTDILTGRPFAVTSDCVRLPSSSGLASGNTILEAVVYGIFEAIERDVLSTYETQFLQRRLSRLELDPDGIQDASVRALMRMLGERGERIVFRYYMNVYGLAVVRCVIDSPERGVRYAGSSCRLSRHDAMVRSFQEAFHAFYIAYVGTREDKYNPDPSSAGAEPQRGRALTLPPEAPTPPALTEVLETLRARLRREGISRVFAIDLSPKSRLGLKCVKIVIPGLDLTLHEGGVWSPYLDKKCRRTDALILRERQDSQARKRQARIGQAP